MHLGSSLSRPAQRTYQVAPAISRSLASGAQRESPQPTAAAPPPPDADAVFERGIDQLEEGRLASAVQLFAEAATSNHAEGHFYLGLAYDGLLGEDARGELPVDKDPAAAARCYLRASELGHAEAMFNLSLSYRLGDGIERDTAAAFAWAERGAAAGCERAQFNLGVALDPQHPPWGTPGESGANAMIAKDPAKAVGYYRQAAEQGHAKAKVNLGIMMYSGDGCAADKPGAVALWREAQEEGVPQADICLRNAEAGLDDRLKK